MRKKIFVIVLSLLVVFCFIAIDAIAQNGICKDPNIDTDGDGIPDCYDECPNDPEKIEPEDCGCGNPEISECGECEDPDMDIDGDGTPDCKDECPTDPEKITPGRCGCGNPEDFTTDTDGDRILDCYDQCPTDPNKIKPGECGCGEPEIPWCTCEDPNTDSDGDGTPDFCGDECPNDPKKIEPGMCGCGKSEDTKIDTDRDGEPDCFDECHTDPNKIDPGMCGCTKPEIEGCIFCEDPFMDKDGDRRLDCDEECPNDPDKTAKGECGCGKPEDFKTDTDRDGTVDCYDECPNDPNKTVKGKCGCEEIEIPGCGMCEDIITDTDRDGTIDCLDECPNDPRKIEEGMCGCGKIEDPFIDTDGDGELDCDEKCHTDPKKISPGFCGCGKPEDPTDKDGDGIPDCRDECPIDPNKTTPGICGCGIPDVDADRDGVLICNDCDDTDTTIFPSALEICDNKDNDCDGRVDEGLVRRCSNKCGEGTETCVNGRWINCDVPQVKKEICDGEDNDCDGAVDEDLGTTTCGLGECEHTIKNCINGVTQTCDSMEGASEETCDVKDNDCDGATDEDLVRECSTICGPGIETCVNGQWENCTAPAPPCEEECIFTAKITGTGQCITGLENYTSRMIIGIDYFASKVESPPSDPPDSTVVLNIKDGDDNYKEDIREQGAEEEEWKLEIKVPGSELEGKADPNKPGYFPLLSWDPNEFCPPSPNTGYFRLYYEDAQGKRILLIPDMTQIGQYQTDGEDTPLCIGRTCILNYYIVLSRDIEVEINLTEGWSMVSLPLILSDAGLSEVFPGTAVMYRFERGAGYVRVLPNEDLQIGTGYWILMYEDQNYRLTGQPITSYSKTVYSSGWEMIGGCTSDAQPITDSCDIGVIYRFVRGSGYVRVSSTQMMGPGEGYWILFTDIVDQCNLTVEITGH